MQRVIPVSCEDLEGDRFVVTALQGSDQRLPQDSAGTHRQVQVRPAVVVMQVNM